MVPTELACLQGEENCLWYVLVLCGTNITYMFTRRRELSLIRSSLVWYQQNLHVYKEKRIVSDTNRTCMLTRRRKLSDSIQACVVPTELTCLQGEENCLWYQQSIHVYKEKRIVFDTNRTYRLTRRRKLSLIHSRLVWYQQNLYVHKEKRIVSDSF